jgi:hypothetical protein
MLAPVFGLALILVLAEQQCPVLYSPVVAAEQEKQASHGAGGKTPENTRPGNGDRRLSAKEALKGIRKQIPSARTISDEKMALEIIPGHYLPAVTDAFALAGDEFYFLPDKTYLWLCWADISPLEICDKGTWDYRSGFVVLKTDGTIQSSLAPINVNYFPGIMPAKWLARDASDAKGRPNNGPIAPGQKATAPEKTEEYLLIGVDYGLRRFVEKGADWEYLRFWAYRKVESITPQQSKAKKDKLLKDFFPERFQRLIEEAVRKHR